MSNGHQETLWYASKKETGFQIALMDDGWDSPVYLYNEQVYEGNYMLKIC